MIFVSHCDYRKSILLWRPRLKTGNVWSHSHLHHIQVETGSSTTNSTFTLMVGYSWLMVWKWSLKTRNWSRIGSWSWLLVVGSGLNIQGNTVMHAYSSNVVYTQAAPTWSMLILVAIFYRSERSMHTCHVDERTHASHLDECQLTHQRPMSPCRSHMPQDALKFT